MLGKVLGGGDAVNRGFLSTGLEIVVGMLLMREEKKEKKRGLTLVYYCG